MSVVIALAIVYKPELIAIIRFKMERVLENWRTALFYRNSHSTAIVTITMLSNATRQPNLLVVLR